MIESVSLTTTSISITSAIPADSGMYTCYAVNIAGTGHSGSVNLTVYGGRVTQTFYFVFHLFIYSFIYFIELFRF